MRDTFTVLVAFFVVIIVFYGLAAVVSGGEYNFSTYGWIGFWIWMLLGAVVGVRIGIAIVDDE
jgi:hypothetical protein